MELHRVSIGIAAATGPDVARRIAPLIEGAGLGGLWVNETPGADALEVAAAALEATETIRVATGVIPVDRRPAAELLAELARLRLPLQRLTLGIGSGGRRAGALDLMRDAIAELRAGGVPDIALGALGPKMRRLAAERADGVVLNWLTPAAAAAQTAEHHDVDPAGRVVLYVRTAAEDAAVPRLEEEAARYGGFPSYAANFERLGFGPLDTVIRPGEARERIPAYLDAVDEVVLRAVTAGDDPDDYARFVETVTAAIR
ncbi:LLM class flavin-dependent oxidoreductase [Microbacterium paludicola]|uniref:LLM class flavin-dependent oxidoreductase n=1 Tax=Microbacterium paludicola TaxID=300019 RepID=A0A4Y9FZ34_9MICO|nr:LLM class flavin-dependent oxidoreductase [Microbacterium paludicola]MBF0815156.1 LLM class flavin-dependent oxidoreductase [Microbacterium paludicola]TFU34418.1 LLM class flavin-dependent oxidoreductase [Microbacterium paludicola]